MSRRKEPRDIYGLTRNQIQALILLAQGYTQHEVGHQLRLAKPTLEKMLSNDESRGAYPKIGVSSNKEAVRWVLEHQAELEARGWQVNPHETEPSLESEASTLEYITAQLTQLSQDVYAGRSQATSAHLRLVFTTLDQFQTRYPAEIDQKRIQRLIAIASLVQLEALTETASVDHLKAHASSYLERLADTRQQLQWFPQTAFDAVWYEKSIIMRAEVVYAYDDLHLDKHRQFFAGTLQRLTQPYTLAPTLRRAPILTARMIQSGQLDRTTGLTQLERDEGTALDYLERLPTDAYEARLVVYEGLAFARFLIQDPYALVWLDHAQQIANHLPDAPGYRANAYGSLLRTACLFTIANPDVPPSQIQSMVLETILKLTHFGFQRHGLSVAEALIQHPDRGLQQLGQDLQLSLTLLNE